MIDDVQSFVIDLSPDDTRLWRGRAPGSVLNHGGGERTISVELKELPSRFDTRSLAREIEVVSSANVELAQLWTGCNKLVLDVSPGSDKLAEEVVLEWLESLQQHIADLPSIDELMSSDAPVFSTEDAMAAPSVGGFYERGR